MLKVARVQLIDWKWPGGTSAIAVKLAAVRWTKGNRFGVEFIRMGRWDQAILETFMAEHAHE